MKKTTSDSERDLREGNANVSPSVPVSRPPHPVQHHEGYTFAATLSGVVLAFETSAMFVPWDVLDRIMLSWPCMTSDSDQAIYDFKHKPEIERPAKPGVEHGDHGVCAIQHKLGYKCTLELGHHGPHIAQARNTKPLYTWWSIKT